MDIDLERRYKLLTARDKRNAYQRAYQAKKKAARTPEQHEQFKAWRREYQKKRRKQNKNKPKPLYEKTLIERLNESYEKQKTNQRIQKAEKRAKLTPEQLEREKEYARNYREKNKEKIASYARQRRLAEKKLKELNESEKESLNNGKRKKFIDSIIDRS